MPHMKSLKQLKSNHLLDLGLNNPIPLMVVLPLQFAFALQKKVEQAVFTFDLLLLDAVLPDGDGDSSHVDLVLDAGEDVLYRNDGCSWIDCTWRGDGWTVWVCHIR